MKRVKDVRCPRCAGLFTPDQVRAANPTARCSFCKTELLVKLPPPPAPPPPPPRMPIGFDVAEIPSSTARSAPTGGPYRSSAPLPERPTLQISWRDRRFLGWFICFGLPMAPVIPIIAIAEGLHPVLVFPIAWLSLFTYLSVARATNRVSLHVDARGLHWSQGPLPLPAMPRRHVSVADVDQLFVIKEMGNDRETGWSGAGMAETVHYPLKVKLRTGAVYELADLATPEQARWLEWAIERHLGIEDRPVERELT